MVDYGLYGWVLYVILLFDRLIGFPNVPNVV